MKKKSTLKSSQRGTLRTLFLPKYFSKKRQIIFVIIFAAVGSYFIWSSSAATEAFATMEAESMSLPAGGEKLSDSMASGGKYLRMTAPGVASGTQAPLASAATHASVKARTTACTGGSVEMRIKVGVGLDTPIVKTFNVSASTWTDLGKFDVALAQASTPTVEVEMVSPPYTEKAGKSNNIKCQRKLDIDSIIFYGSVAGPEPLPTVNISASPTSVSSGGISTLTWSSTNATSCAASGAWTGAKDTNGTASTGILNTTSTYTLSCSGPGGNANKSVTVTVGPTGGETVLFEDQFNAAAGTPADSTKWTHRGPSCEGFLGQAGSKSENTFHDGAGNLVIRTKREAGFAPATGCATHYYSTDIISNFSYGYGWPATGVKASWPVPFRIELRAQYPALTGGWGGAWLMNTDRNHAQKLTEIDFSEMRTYNPAVHQAHQHLWGVTETDPTVKDRSPWDCTAPTPSTYNMTTAPHIYSADVYADRIVYKVDGITCGTRTEPVFGRFGAILNFGIGDPGTWGSGYTSGPPSSDPGPWDVKYDYLRVTAL